MELITFTDSDGRVGARVAAKLADDFRRHARKAGKRGRSGLPALLPLYEEFATGFALAARGGVLVFC
ncbi:MAG: hypothetical protein JWO38_7857 [Gemmataceae bacterium]|nr:hypothetical protein [Gemmataceae bacterium]